VHKIAGESIKESPVLGFTFTKNIVAKEPDGRGAAVLFPEFVAIWGRPNELRHKNSADVIFPLTVNVELEYVTKEFPTPTLLVLPIITPNGAPENVTPPATPCTPVAPGGPARPVCPIPRKGDPGFP